MPTLYRQYRPQRFADIIGQGHITGLLTQAIVKAQLAHAYLFYGPRGTGKTTTARVLAKRVNCTLAKDAEPCGTCPLCVATQAGRNLDLIEIDAASNRGIDDIRALKDGIGLTPAIGKYKVYIIDEVHMLTHEAFTALLKTLEEPVAHALFILATTELHKVPETILSRCQVYRFRRATTEEMRTRLQFLLQQEKREADNTALDFIIHRSDGCYRDAESLLGQMLTLQDKQVTVNALTEFLGIPSPAVIDELLTALVQGVATPALDVVDKAFAAGFDPEQVLKECIVRARDGAVALAQGNTNAFTFANEPQAAARLPIVIRALLQAMQDLAYVPQPLLALHLAVLTVCNKSGAKDSPPAGLSAKAEGGVRGGGRYFETTPSQPATPRVTPSAVPSGEPTLAQVQAVWPHVIQTIKNTNPVAATFLRSIEPIGINNTIVQLEAHYDLHQNFFQKTTNRVPVEQALSELLQTPVTIQCRLRESQPSPHPWQKPAPAEELLTAVKEVFGSG